MLDLVACLIRNPLRNEETICLQVTRSKKELGLVAKRAFRLKVMFSVVKLLRQLE